MNFGEKLKFWCVNIFGSMANASKQLDIKASDLSRYANNKVKPTITFLAKLLNWGCDINWLLADDSGPPGVSEPLAEYKNKKLEEENAELKAENDSLRSQIGRIVTIAQAVEVEKKLNKKK